MDAEIKAITRRAIELSGGKKALNEKVDSKLQLINEKWVQDVGSIGRILRAHLFIEHFMTECIERLNPMFDLDEARLTFSQKLALIKGYSSETQKLAPGIKKLNQIRNRLAHNLKANITKQDIEPLLSNLHFRVLRESLAEPRTPSSEPLDVLEDFAKHVGCRFEAMSDPDSFEKHLEQAFHELSKKE